MISHEVRNSLSAILYCTKDILEVVKGKECSGVPVLLYFASKEDCRRCPFVLETRRLNVKLVTAKKLARTLIGTDIIYISTGTLEILINLVLNAIKFTAKANNKREIRISIGASL
ncbi:hypothetical protein N7507_010019 [Penicillium longicatenatum]|nr:hypothetical protein N7507_010019 [Penicillium longicatenatum]